MNTELGKLMREYEIRRLKKMCNVKDCNSNTEKEIAIYEIDVYTGKSKTIMSIYLCKRHFYEEQDKIIGYVKHIKEYGKKFVVRYFSVE